MAAEPFFDTKIIIHMFLCERYDQAIELLDFMIERDSGQSCWGYYMLLVHAHCYKKDDARQEAVLLEMN